MTFREYARRFFLSAPGLGSLVLGAAAALAAAAGGLGAAGAIVAGLAAVALLFVVGLATGLGPRAAAREAERLRAERDRGLNAAAADTRRRLAALRIAEPAVAAARDLVVLEAGRYVESASSTGLRDPHAAAALEESLALVDAWLREADETATERRFGGGDAHPFPEAAARVATALRDKAAALVRARDAVSAGPAGADRLAAEEELK